MKSKSIGAEILNKLCAEWPDVPSRTIARMAFKQNKGVWPSIDVARSAVRYRRGRNGNSLRRKPGLDSGAYPSTAPSKPWNPDGFLPKSDEGSFEPFIIDPSPKKTLRIASLSDIHIPYHNGPALRHAIERLRKNLPDVLLLNGDTLDFYQASRFEKDPRNRNTVSEIKLANQFLDALDDYFPKARKIWKDGNHDERYNLYAMARAPELFEIVKEHASLDKLLELEDRGWEYVTGKRPIYAGELTILHGHEYPTPVLGPVNAARGLFLRTKAPTLTAHHHQISSHDEPTVRGVAIPTWSQGCLCWLHPEYARFNKWRHGFAEIELHSDGSFELFNHKIKLK